jgi:Tfp pilus assembly PilM family ATPase
MVNLREKCFQLGEIDMLSFLQKRVYPIGADLGDDVIKVVQLGNNGKGISVIAGGSQDRPQDVIPGSSNWQRWAIEAIRGLTANGTFRGRDVIAVMPANKVFIDHIRKPRIIVNSQNARRKAAAEPDDKLRDVIFSKIKQKLPFEHSDAMMKYIPAEENNVVAIASERKEIDRHLAIYEKANLMIKSIGIWPIALINCYTTFFGRRKSDTEAVVMLLEMNAGCTNVVICRYKNLLFARSIPIGTSQLESDEGIGRLVLELTACRRQFSSMQRKAQMQRIIFLSSEAAITNICASIAKQMEMPAQIGNCLAAVEIENSCRPGIDRRDCQVNWTTAVGLSLSLS